MAAHAITQGTGELADGREVACGWTLGELMALNKFKIVIWKSVYVYSSKTPHGPHSKVI